MLSRDQFVVDPPVLVSEELEERASDTLPFVVDQILDEPAEPRRVDVVLHPLVRLAVANKLNRSRQNGGLLFATDGEQVCIDHDVFVKVDQFHSPREVDKLGLPDRFHVCRYVEPSAAGGLQDDRLRRRLSNITAGGYPFAFFAARHIRNSYFVSGCCESGIGRRPNGPPPFRSPATRLRRCLPFVHL